MRKIGNAAMAFCLSLAALVGAGTAQADGTLTAGEESLGDAISAELCDYLDSDGVTYRTMSTSMRIIYQSDDVLTPSDAVDVINYAVWNYCPRHWNELVSFGEGFRNG